MSKFDKVPCEYCGEEVSIHHKAQDAHMKKCKGRPEMNEVKVEKQVIEEAKKADMDGVDPEAAELYRISMQARETRKESPEVFVAGMTTDERKELIRRYAPDCVDPHYDPRARGPRKHAEMHACWVSKQKALIFAHRSYEPVFNEYKQQVQHDGDLLFKIPRSMWLDVVMAESNESKRWREAATDLEAEQLKAGAGEYAEYTAERRTETLE